MNRSRIVRRQFLTQSAVAASSLFAMPAIVSAATLRKELHVAAIGVNGMGWSDLSNVGSHASVRFVGFCDIDTARFDKADAAFAGVPHFADYRQLLADLGEKVDAVIVSTPDHMHAPIAMAAMKHGKHVYCQKPLTHTVWESRQMRLLAEQNKLTTQMGNQIHSNAEYRLGVKLIQDGAIGKVSEVHSWVGVQGRQYCNRTDRPADAPVPEGVNWDLWLGAAPVRSFAADVYHPFKWRDWQDFGSGAMGDFGCHILDPVFSALKLTAPNSLWADAPPINKEIWTKWSTVHYEFPGTEYTSGKTINVTWYDGEGHLPANDLLGLPAGFALPGSGSVLVGEKGSLLVPHVAMPKLFPEDKFADFKIEMVPARDHYVSWADACRGVDKTTSHFDYACPLTETVLLGTIALRLPSQTLQWNSVALKITNNDKANGLLTKPYRQGFEPTWIS